MKFVLYLCHFANDQAEPERLSWAERVKASSPMTACAGVDRDWNNWLTRTYPSWAAKDKQPNGYVLLDKTGSETRRPITAMKSR